MACICRVRNSINRTGLNATKINKMIRRLQAARKTARPFWGHCKSSLKKINLLSMVAWQLAMQFVVSDIWKMWSRHSESWRLSPLNVTQIFCHSQTAVWLWNSWTENRKTSNSIKLILNTKTRRSLLDMHNDVHGLLFWRLQQHIISKLLLGRVTKFRLLRPTTLLDALAAQSHLLLGCNSH